MKSVFRRAFVLLVAIFCASIVETAQAPERALAEQPSAPSERAVREIFFLGGLGLGALVALHNWPTIRRRFTSTAARASLRGGHSESR